MTDPRPHYASLLTALLVGFRTASTALGTHQFEQMMRALDVTGPVLSLLSLVYDSTVTLIVMAVVYFVVTVLLARLPAGPEAKNPQATMYGPSVYPQDGSAAIVFQSSDARPLRLRSVRAYAWASGGEAVPWGPGGSDRVELDVGSPTESGQGWTLTLLQLPSVTGVHRLTWELGRVEVRR